MDPLIAVAVLLASHFVADFCLQSDKMAINKSKDWLMLAYHVAVYTFAMSLPWLFIPFAWNMDRVLLQFIMVTFVTHFLTDAVTSRITTALYVAQARHWFFVMIGLDQLIHGLTLIFTARWLGLI